MGTLPKPPQPTPICVVIKGREQRQGIAAEAEFGVGNEAPGFSTCPAAY